MPAFAPANQALTSRNIAAICKLEPLNSLTDEQIIEIAHQSVLESMVAGQSVFETIDTSGVLLYLLAGELTLSGDSGSSHRQLVANSEEARHPLASDGASPLKAVATSASEILCVDKDLLDTFLAWGQISAPEEEVVMCEDGILTINKADWLKTMIKSPTFRNLPPANIEELLHRLEPVVVKAGELIICQGDVGDYFYMIDEGTALVTRNPDNDEDSIEMAELNKGASFGEAALISDNPRNATVSMMTDGILLRLSKEDFNKLLKSPTLNWVNYGRGKEQVTAGARWIDVRLESEYQHGHLPGAINIPMQSLHKQARELDKSIPYICYCQTGRRSSAAAFVLSNYGLDAGVLEDGIQNIPGEMVSG